MLNVVEDKSFFLCFKSWRFLLKRHTFITKTFNKYSPGHKGHSPVPIFMLRFKNHVFQSSELNNFDQRLKSVWYRCLIIRVRPFLYEEVWLSQFGKIYPYIVLLPQIKTYKIKILVTYRRSLVFFRKQIHGANPFCYLTGLCLWSYLDKIMLNFQMATNEEKGGENNWCLWHSIWLWIAGGTLPERDYEIHTIRLETRGKASQLQHNLRSKSELK